MDCLFCKIAAGEIPSAKVYEDDRVLVFKDINPVAPVHLLAIPKEHIQSVDAVDASNCELVYTFFRGFETFLSIPMSHRMHTPPTNESRYNQRQHIFGNRQIERTITISPIIDTLDLSFIRSVLSDIKTFISLPVKPMARCCEEVHWVVS